MTNTASQTCATPVQSSAITVHTEGEGDDQRRILQCDQWELVEHVGRGDSEPRIRDIELGEKLGYEDPRKIRDLIKSHARAGNINPFRNVRATRRFAKDGTSRGDVRATEFYLSEAEALFIASQSGTDRAVALTKEMIAVYIAVRRGLHEAATTAAFARIEAAMETRVLAIVGKFEKDTVAVREELDELRDRVANDGGTVTPEWASRTRARITSAAKWYEIGGISTARSMRRRIENQLRNALDFNGPGTKWESFPRESRLLRIAERKLTELEGCAQRAAEEAIRASHQRAANHQLSLLGLDGKPRLN